MTQAEPQLALALDPSYEHALQRRLDDARIARAQRDLLAQRSVDRSAERGPVEFAQLLAAMPGFGAAPRAPAVPIPPNVPELLHPFYEHSARVATVGGAIEAWQQHRYALGVVGDGARRVAWQHLLAILRRLPDATDATVQRFKETLAAEVARRRQTYERLANAMGLPRDDVRQYVYDDWLVESDALRAFREAWAWRVKNQAPFVKIVSGAKGLGKTVAAGHVMLRVSPESAVCVPASLAGNPRRAGPQTQIEWERWRTERLVLLDDLGTEEDPTPIVDLLWSRFTSGRGTFVTCNMAREVVLHRYFESAIGDRLHARLTETQSGERGLTPFTSVDGPVLRNVAQRKQWLEKARTASDR